MYLDVVWVDLVLWQNVECAVVLSALEDAAAGIMPAKSITQIVWNVFRWRTYIYFPFVPSRRKVCFYEDCSTLNNSFFSVHSPSHLYSHFGGAVWLLPRQLQPRTYYQPQAQLECSVGVVYGRDWTYLHRKKKKCFDEQDLVLKEVRKRRGLI